ncbi:MAG: lipid asymmetry maintenance protein MlaB [Gammaproteobacteria bacterium]
MNEAPTLRIEGPVTLVTYTRLRAALDAHLAAGGRVIDWSGSAAVDSSALSLILHGQRQGGALEHRALPPALDALAALYGVGELLAGRARDG